MNTPSLGKTLKSLRVAAGLTLEDLADKAGVSRATLANLESGANANPKLATLEAIAVPLGVTVRALLSLAERVDHRPRPRTRATHPAPVTRSDS